VAKEEIEANAALVSSLFTFLLCGIPVPLAPCFVYVIKGNYPISLLLVTSKNADLSVFPGYWQFLPEGLLCVKGLLRMKE